MPSLHVQIFFDQSGVWKKLTTQLTKTWKQTKECFFIRMYFGVFILVTENLPVTYVRSTWVVGHFENKTPSVCSNWPRCAQSIQQNLRHFILEVTANSCSSKMAVSTSINEMRHNGSVCGGEGDVGNDIDTGAIGLAGYSSYRVVGD